MADDRERLNNRLARYTISPRLYQGLGENEPGDGPEDLRADNDDPEPRRTRIIIEVNMNFPGGVDAARLRVSEMLEDMGILPNWYSADRSRYNVFARVTKTQLDLIVAEIETAKAPTAIYKVWPDEPLKPLLTRSVRTVKSDACLNTFGANGQDMIWAVADSGIDKDHAHFALHRNLLDLPGTIDHRDFSQDPGQEGDPLTDGYGHGTHVAGIIAGEMPATADRPVMRIYQTQDARGTIVTRMVELKDPIRGIAPRCKLLSLKVMDDDGEGNASNLIAALEYLESLNEFGRRVRVHGVNLSVGYAFDASWYAAGQSPLCIAVNRIARAGIVVVAAAGNNGAALLNPEGSHGSQRIGLAQSINDPGNAEGAITVGATHNESPHRYGVSYFSSRGPTADGRAKPDLVAPGERILSCAAESSQGLQSVLAEVKSPPVAGTAYYREESGTSMAAPHVSGAAAALLSIRQEFIGRPEEVKTILCGSCTDLKRVPEFRGAGLIDLMRAIQSV